MVYFLLFITMFACSFVLKVSGLFYGMLFFTTFSVLILPLLARVIIASRFSLKFHFKALLLATLSGILGMFIFFLIL